MGHVANVVGGVQEINLYYGDANRRFFPQFRRLPAAGRFLSPGTCAAHARHFTGEDIVSRLTAEGTAQKILNAQNRAPEFDLQPAHQPVGRDRANLHQRHPILPRNFSAICATAFSAN
jgi:hypothetical protein